MNLLYMCRICLDEKRKLQTIFTANIPKMIMSCTAVVIVEGDGLPDKICLQCITTISRMYQFKELCEKSDIKLRDYIAMKINKEISEIKTELLLDDILMKTAEPLTIEQSTDIDNIQTLGDQCLPSLWNIQRSTNSNLLPCNNAVVDSLSINQQSFCSNALETLDLDKKTKVYGNTAEESVKSSFICEEPNCNKVFPDLHTLKIHIRSMHRSKQKITNEKNYLCNFCGFRYNNLKSLNTHLKTHSTKNIVHCDICGKGFKHNIYLNKHRKFHHGNGNMKIRRCPVCSKSFLKLSYYNNHINKHEGQKYKCNICERIFSQEYNYTQHMKSHIDLEEQIFKCHTCEITVSNLSELISHANKTHNVDGKKFICTLCGKLFANKGYLNVHYRIHRNEKPFSCDDCEASFATNSQLTKHKTVHTGQKSYLCAYCNSSFARKETKDTHERSHSNERPYACSKCPKRFCASSHLRAHMLSHTDERRHQCHVCNKWFLQRRHLKAHMDSHTGQRPHACSYCNSSFTNSGTLSRHMKRHQNQNNDPSTQ